MEGRMSRGRGGSWKKGDRGGKEGGGFDGERRGRGRGGQHRGRGKRGHHHGRGRAHAAEFHHRGDDDDEEHVPEEEEVAGMFSRRKLESNWDRYKDSEKVECEDDVPTCRGTDFDVLLAAAGDSFSQFRFSEEKDWGLDSFSINEITASLLDLPALADLLQQLPLHRRLDLEPELFQVRCHFGSHNFPPGSLCSGRLSTSSRCSPFPPQPLTLEAPPTSTSAPKREAVRVPETERRVPAFKAPPASFPPVVLESRTPAAKTPATKIPAAKTPAAKTPAAKTPAAKTPAAKTPAAAPGPQAAAGSAAAGTAAAGSAAAGSAAAGTAAPSLLAQHHDHDDDNDELLDQLLGLGQPVSAASGSQSDQSVSVPPQAREDTKEVSQEVEKNDEEEEEEEEKGKPAAPPRKEVTEEELENWLDSMIS